jgi:hypothetical protein
LSQKVQFLSLKNPIFVPKITVFVSKITIFVSKITIFVLKIKIFISKIKIFVSKAKNYFFLKMVFAFFVLRGDEILFVKMYIFISNVHKFEAKK